MAAKPRDGNEFRLDGSNGTGEQAGNGPNGNGGNAGGNSGTIDPATLAPGGTASDGTGEPPKRGRGRPKGSGTGAGSKAQGKASLDIGSVETLLFNIHGMLAAATKIDALALNNTEANSLASAVVNVQQYYPMHISAKALAWSNLIMVAGSVYGSRAVTIWAEMKIKEQEANNPASPPSNVHPINTAR